jgi:hypothetical protein
MCLGKWWAKVRSASKTTYSPTARVRRALNEETKEEVAIKEIDKEQVKQVDLAEHLKKEISFVMSKD